MGRPCGKHLFRPPRRVHVIKGISIGVITSRHWTLLTFLYIYYGLFASRQTTLYCTTNDRKQKGEKGKTKKKRKNISSCLLLRASSKSVAIGMSDTLATNAERHVEDRSEEKQESHD